MLIRILSVVSIAIATTGTAQAASFETITPTDSTKLFTTEMKRDEGGNGSQSGHDIFPRNGDSFTTPVSYNFDWGGSGTT